MISNPKNEVLIWGIHPVREFIKTRPDACRGIFVYPSFGKKKTQAGLLRLAERHGVDVNPTEDLTKQGIPSGAVHQGVAAWVRPIWSIDFFALPQLWKDKVPLIVVCDQVTDPQNVGAIIRSSVALGAQAILLSGRKTVHITGAVAKASSGALFHTKICQVVNLVRALRQLKEMGLWITGLTPDGKSVLWELNLIISLALVVGAEGVGLRRLVKEVCDFLVKIPRLGPISSMNVASAASIALYEVARQRLSLPAHVTLRQ